MAPRVLFASLLLCLLLVSGTALAAVSPVNVVEPGFQDELVAAVEHPTALAFTPDDRLLITSQTGELWIYHDDQLLPSPALDLSGKLCTNSERGLLGVAVDPQFTSNGYIYLYYTFKKHGSCSTRTPATDPVNRVSRFSFAPANGNSVDPGSERVLIDNIPSPNGNHNGGDLQIGKDGYLYISVGDGGCDYASLDRCAGNNDAARDQHILLGKILRITLDGGIPPDNPFVGPGSARCSNPGDPDDDARTDPGTTCQETYAWGLRNPFRMAFDPNEDTTRFVINDVGQGQWEEINEGIAGADYGWNVREGHCANGSTSDCGDPPVGMTDPLYDYGHSTGCYSITGGAFVPVGAWPSQYDGDYIFGDYGCGNLFRLEPDSDGYTHSDFAVGLGAGSAVHLSFGPASDPRALYYTTYANGGEVRRIVYVGGGNRTPAAVVSAEPTFGSVPLSVRFDASGSSDPDGDQLEYAWDFGDGATLDWSSEDTPVHTYTDRGSYTASLRVRDTQGAVSPAASLRIDAGNTLPEPQIVAPAASDRYSVGEAITLRGSASDAEEGVLDDTALAWEVILHHEDVRYPENSHTHPFVAPTRGNNITFDAPPPEDLWAVDSWLEIRLTATDSDGASQTEVRAFYPKKVGITIESIPPGMRMYLNGFPLTTPVTITSWEHYVITVEVPPQQTDDGEWVAIDTFDGAWVPATFSFITGAAPQTLTATFASTEIVHVPMVYR